MAKMPIEIVKLAGKHSTTLTTAVEDANRCQQDFVYEILSARTCDEFRLHVRTETNTNDFFDVLESRRKEWRGFHPLVFAVIDKQLRSEEWVNLFSARDRQEGLAIFTTANVSDVIIPEDKMVAYFLYELAIHTLGIIASHEIQHKETRGCIFDWKELKSDIILSMNSGAICDECKEWFVNKAEALSSSQLAAILSMLDRCANIMSQSSNPANFKRPKMFIGSSVEGLEVAQALQSGLEYDFEVELWNQNTIFRLGTASVEALESALKQFEFALFVFTPDDLVKKRQESSFTPRDNVIFEAGLFIGKLSRFRAFVVHPRNVEIQIPSDLNGITMATYDGNASSLDAALGPACRNIRQACRDRLASGF